VRNEDSSLVTPGILVDCPTYSALHVQCDLRLQLGICGIPMPIYPI
jgi:hypothetical protein